MPTGSCFATIQYQLYLFGGQDADGRYLKELMIFNQDKNVWQIVKTKGLLPNERAFATMTNVRDNYLLLFGGENSIGTFNDIYFLDFENVNLKQF